MKIPLLPVHILLTSTLQEQAQTQAQAIKEASQFNTRLIANLLHYSAHLERLIKALDQDKHSLRHLRFYEIEQ